MNIGILNGDYVTIIDDTHVLTADSIVHEVSTGKVLDTRIRLGDAYTIVLSKNSAHYFSERALVRILSVASDKDILAYGLDSHKTQIISLEDIGFHLPSKKSPGQWLDLQGEPVKVGDTVMFLTGREIGKRVIVKELSKDFTSRPMMMSDIYHKYMENVLKLNGSLPPHVTMMIKPEDPKTIRVALWNKDNTKVVQHAKATCSDSDTFSFEFGLYGVAIPRLFDRDIRQ